VLIVRVPAWLADTNAYIVADEPGGLAVVVDAPPEPEKVGAVLAEHGLAAVGILLTHGHIDHCGGTAVLARALGVRVEGPQREDRFWIEQLATQSQRFGFEQVEVFEPDRWLEDGDRVQVGKSELDVLYCPGHTPGHIVFFCRSDKVALVGDVLFQGSIGRTDFPRGDSATLIRSIREKLWPLGDDVTFVPGHGPTSTFGHERRTNPFVGDHTGVRP